MMIAYAMNIFNVVLNLYFVFLQKIHIEFAWSANFLASENNVDLLKNFMNYYQTKYVRHAKR